MHKQFDCVINKSNNITIISAFETVKKNSKTNLTFGFAIAPLESNYAVTVDGKERENEKNCHS